MTLDRRAASDFLLRNANPREALIARPTARLEADPDAAAFAWTLVL